MNAKWQKGGVDKPEMFVKYLELDFLGYIEEKFKCSGMCNEGLFYFSRNITYGVP